MNGHHDSSNEACPWNDPETFLHPAMRGLDCTCVNLTTNIETNNTQREEVNHPAHYGGGDNLYEAIKVIEAWELGFCLGNAVKYIARAGKKSPDVLTDLRKAAWYLNREIERLEQR